VIAVDGVLAVGAGAIGGLFATGTGAASAAAPTPGWTGTQSPGITGPDAPGADPQTDLNAVSCVSAVFCADDGSYSDAGGHRRGLLETLEGGSWSAQEAPLPSNADPVNSDPTFKDMSCPTNGWCVGAGYYFDSSGGVYTAFETLSGGRWSTTEAPVPSDALSGSGAQVVATSVSCPAAGSCTAVGYYINSSHQAFGMIDTLSDGTWTEQIAPQPHDAGTNQQAQLDVVSCPTTNFCGVGGHYENSSGGEQADLLTETNGTWAVQDAPVPANAGTLGNASSQAYGISCTTAGVCEAVGYVNDTSGNEFGLLEHLAGGVWTNTPAPEPSGNGSGSDQEAFLNAVSCTFDNGCVAVGGYEDAHATNHPLVESIAGGVPTATAGPEPKDTLGTDSELNAVSCLNMNDCAATGFYRNTSGSAQNIALIDQETNGAWSALPGALPSGAASGAASASELFAVSCAPRGSCDAVGNFHTASTAPGLHDTYTPPEGYWNDASDGGIFTYGSAVFHGSMGGQHLNAPMVGMAETPGPGGYWEVGSDGGIFSFGNAVFHGSTGSLRLNAPIVGMAGTPDGGGYWLVASDGGIFNYGDAGFYGSAGSIRLNKPIVGMAATPDGHGYWLVASDGGIFNYGDAGFFGSSGSIRLNKPVVGMAADATGLGYWLVASDGGIFNYGDASFLGSRGGQPLNKPIVGMMSSFDGAGYWLVASDGGIFSYGDTGFEGSAGSLHLNAPVVGGTPT